MQESVGNFTVDLPPDSLVNFNFAITVIFTLFAPPLYGAVLLPVLLLKKLRTQPYQYLCSNYLSSSLAIVLGFGLYRQVQIGRYMSEGYEVGLRKTACNIMKFFEFPLATSNLCLVLIGFERFYVLYYEKMIEWPTLLLLIALPWALGICQHVTELSSKHRYQNIPYLGLCVNISSEKRARVIITFLLEFAIPFTLALITITLAYATGYSKWKKIKMKQDGLYQLPSAEMAKLRHEERSVLKMTKATNLAATFFILRFFTSLIFRVIHSELEGGDSLQESKNRAGVVGLFLLLLDVTISPILFFIFNSDLRKAICNRMPILMKIPLLYPHDDDEEEEEEVVEHETIEMEDTSEPN